MEELLYEFHSEKAKEWASWNHPGLVKTVQRQLGAFWRRVDMQRIYGEIKASPPKPTNHMPRGYVALYALVKSYNLSKYFVQKAAHELQTAKRIRFQDPAWGKPKWVWVAEETEARAYFEAKSAERDEVLSIHARSFEDQDIPEGAMPVVDIANVLNMSHATLHRWIRQKAVPRAGQFMTKRGKSTRWEVYTWPGHVVNEIIKRNAVFDGRRATQWIGLQGLKESGHGAWIAAARVLECLD